MKACLHRHSVCEDRNLSLRKTDMDRFLSKFVRKNIRPYETTQLHPTHPTCHGRGRIPLSPVAPEPSFRRAAAGARRIRHAQHQTGYTSQHPEYQRRPAQSGRRRQHSGHGPVGAAHALRPPSRRPAGDDTAAAQGARRQACRPVRLQGEALSRDRRS